LDINPTDGVFFMAKHSERLKLEVVQRYLSGEAGHRVLAAEYGVAQELLRRWIAAYRVHGKAGLEGTRLGKRYSAEFKLDLLRRAECEKLSNTKAAMLFDVRGGGAMVALWRRQYDEGGPQALHPKPRGCPPKNMPTPKSTPAAPEKTEDKRSLEELREENEQLRTEVAYLKKLEALVRANRQAALKGRKPSSN
jgi:transposase